MFGNEKQQVATRFVVTTGSLVITLAAVDINRVAAQICRAGQSQVWAKHAAKLEC